MASTQQGRAQNPTEERRLKTLESMGFPTSVSFAHALKDWAETHRWSFTTMTKATVLLHGGPETLMLDTSTPCFMSYTIIQNQHSDGSPATTFRVDSVAIITPDDYKNDNGFLLRAWEDAEAGRMAMDASYRKDRNPAFAGVISVVYILKDTGMAVHNQHPVYRARRGPLDEATKTMVLDLMGLCKGSVNAGCSLRAPNEYVHVPTPGLLVRAKKTWDWVPLMKTPETWNKLAKHLLPLYVVQSGLLPKDLFERFAML
ncbi:hypothetical protein BD309DRAFT_1019008 [Dichomitus squalens]|uniref:Uncharacterized protein n=1 Tax=Dichomitus squalens TaxID=114155 RepID=A0A4Q9NUV7_9APHY|nr:hypothetical protein BD309DRAFT_1019008 [Dichomitus squalens]TBU57059.1 hypothetical protein BD310DRAFT_978420 [Dichomitus squalens]